MKFDGFDYWAISFKKSEILNASANELTMKIKRCAFLYQIILGEKQAGNIVEPDDLRTGIDFTTKFAKNSETDSPNHKANRGFINWVSDTFTSSSYPEEPENQGTDYISYYPETKSRNYFLAYVKAAMFYSREKFYQKYPKETYPLISQKYELVVSYMKSKYGIDLEGIAKGPETKNEQK